MSDKIQWHYIQLGRIDERKDPSELTSVEQLAAYPKYAHDENRKDYLQKLIQATEVVSVTEEVFGKMTEEEIADEIREDEERYEHLIATLLSHKEDEVTEKVTKSVTEKINAMNQQLIAAKRYDDLERATRDAEFRESLYKEFGLSEPGE